MSDIYDNVDTDSYKELYEKMILGGVANLRKNLQKVNDLKFPHYLLLQFFVPYKKLHYQGKKQYLDITKTLC